MREVWLIIICSLSVATYYYKHSFLLYFIIGSFISLITSLFLHNLLLESICFISFSLLLQLISTYHPYNKSSKHSLFDTSTTTAYLIGTQGIVTKKIGQTYLETGLVKLDHEIWPAVSQSGHPIPRGELVEIKDIKGVHVVVSLIHKKGD